MDIPKISRNTSGAKWRWEERAEQWSVLMATQMTLRIPLKFMNTFSLPYPWVLLRYNQLQIKNILKIFVCTEHV
jgi:hypothetical protein